MPNFNISKGYSHDLASQPIVDGYMYVSLDEQKLYIDDRTTRFDLNAKKADMLKGDDLPEKPDQPIGENELIPWDWDTINKILISGRTEEYIGLGALAKANLSTAVLDTQGEILIQVIDINKDVANSLTFQTKYALNDITAYGTGVQWNSSTVKTLCGEFYNALDIKDRITAVNKGSTKTYKSSNISYDTEYIWLPSTDELELSPDNPPLADEYTEGVSTPYAYYANGADLKKTTINGEERRWWLRSKNSKTSSTPLYVFAINASGAIFRCNYSISTNNTLAPCFVIAGQGEYTSAPSYTAQDIKDEFDSVKRSINDCEPLVWGSFTDLN